MDEHRVQCEFFIPIVRDSDKKPHQPVAWNLLVNEIRRVFPAGHTGPEIGDQEHEKESHSQLPDGLTIRSPVYRICQDLEARLGINLGTVSPPDYRDYLADLIDAQFGSRQEFCKSTGVDPGQLNRVFAGRADLSIRALEKVLEVLHARLVIQTDQEVCERASVAHAVKALAMAAHQTSLPFTGGIRQEFRFFLEEPGQQVRGFWELAEPADC